MLSGDGDLQSPREFFKTQILWPHCRLRRCRLRSASSTLRARSWVHTRETEEPGSERVSWPSYQGPDFRSGCFLGASNPILHFLLCWSQNAFFGWYFLIFPSTLREKAMATHSSVLAWGIPGTGEPDRLPSMGSHRVGHNWSDLAAAAAAPWDRFFHMYFVWEQTEVFAERRRLRELLPRSPSKWQSLAFRPLLLSFLWGASWHERQTTGTTEVVPVHICQPVSHK